jgi:Leu/Phe-tRNA-protein transferase
MSMKNSNETIRNRTSDVLNCSVVPQQTAPPRTTNAMNNMEKIILWVSKSKIFPWVSNSKIILWVSNTNRVSNDVLVLELQHVKRQFKQHRFNALYKT